MSKKAEKNNERELTAAQLRDVAEGLKELGELELSASSRFHILRLREEITPPLQAFEEARQELCKKYARKKKGEPQKKETDEGVVWDIPESKLQDFQEELIELANQKSIITRTLREEHFMTFHRNKSVPLSISEQILGKLLPILDLDG